MLQWHSVFDSIKLFKYNIYLFKYVTKKAVFKAISNVVFVHMKEYVTFLMFLSIIILYSGMSYCNISYIVLKTVEITLLVHNHVYVHVHTESILYVMVYVCLRVNFTRKLVKFWLNILILCRKLIPNDRNSPYEVLR